MGVFLTIYGELGAALYANDHKDARAERVRTIGVHQHELLLGERATCRVNFVNFMRKREIRTLPTQCG